MPEPRRRWNVVAGASVALSLLWVGAAAGFVYAGKATFTEAAAAVGPIVGGWLTQMARILGGPE